MGLQRFVLMWLVGLLLASVVPEAAAGAEAALRGMAVLEDASGSETIASISTADPARFRTLPGPALEAGYSRSAHWLRFQIEAPAGPWWLDILPSYLDDIRLFEPDLAHPGQFIERRAGDRLPFAAREVAHRGFVFKLNKTDDLTRTYYLRLQTSSTSLLVPRLSSPEAFHASSKVEYALLTGSLAMLLTVLMLDGVAAMYWRDATSKWFFAFLASMVLSNMNVSGFTAEYLLPDAPAVTDALTSLAALLVTTLGSGFYVRLYAIQPTQKIAYTLFQVGAWLPLLTMPTVYSGHYVLVVPWIVKLTLLLIVVGSWLSYRNWRSGASGGGWIFAANLISVLGYGVYNLSLGGILPWHLTPLYALQIATLGSVLTLHFALAARHRDMDQVRVDSEKLARAAELKAEMEHDNRLQQGKLLSMIAHEIRNALAVLRMAIGQQPMSAALIARADRAIHSMTSVIERTLQLERIAEDTSALKAERFDLAALLDAAIANSQEPGRVQVRLALRPTLCGDANLVQIILTNLIENALKYSAPASPVDVALALDAANPQDALITVANSVGVAGRPDTQQLFEKYYRASGASSHTGSGLGLHLSRHMARRLGGDLQYIAGAERIEFCLRLPLIAKM